METKTANIFATGNAPAKDWFLQFLVNLANKNRFELDITLTVGGFLVAGTLTGVRKYFDELGTYFARPFLASENAREVSATFKEIGAQCACVSPSEQTETPSYIHLKNVTFYSGNGSRIGDEKVTWWRGRLSEVQGFSPGKPDGDTRLQ